MVVQDLDLRVGMGEFFTLLGLSGLGKTTCLMMLAGFEAPTLGEISIAGRSVHNLAPRKGEYSVMASDAIARHKSGKSVLYFAWSPHWIQDILQPGKDVEMLEVPFTSIPDRQTKAEDTTFFGKNLGHIPWNMNIMANNEFLKKNPAAHALFKVVRIPIEDVSAQNKLIYEGETSPEDIKRHTDAWIAKHRSAYDGYLKAARDAAAK